MGMTVRSRTITFSVSRKTGDVFEAILDSPKKMVAGATKSSDGWWSFSIPRGPAKLKFFENKEQGILDYVFIDPDGQWTVPMRVVSSGEESEVIITLVKPDFLTDEQFNDRFVELSQVVENMKSSL